MRIKHPLLFALLFLWMGIFISISFVETPLKFQVTGMTLPIALELGRLTFAVSTNIQLILLFFVLLLLFVNRNKMNKSTIVSAILLTIVLSLEKFWLLPVLDTRAAILITGKGVPPSPLHDYFIYAEIFKLLILIVFCITLITKKDEQTFY